MKSEINDIPISNSGYGQRKSEVNETRLAVDGQNHTVEHPTYSEMGEKYVPKPKAKAKGLNLAFLKMFVAVAASISILQIGIYVPIFSDFFDEAVAPAPAVTPATPVAPPAQTVTVSFANLVIDATGVKGDVNTTTDVGTIDAATLFYYLYLYLGTSYSTTAPLIKGPDYLVTNSINFNFGGLVSNTNYYLVVLDSGGNEIVGQVIHTDLGLGFNGANVYCESGDTKIQLDFYDDFGYWSNFYVELWSSLYGVVTLQFDDANLHNINQFSATIMASGEYTLDVYCVTTEPGKESDNNQSVGDGAYRWKIYTNTYNLDKFA